MPKLKRMNHQLPNAEILFADPLFIELVLQQPLLPEIRHFEILIKSGAHLGRGFLMLVSGLPEGAPVFDIHHFVYTLIPVHDSDRSRVKTGAGI